ncbi:hypothetical protein [Cohnella herbarum]|uniref:Uncharacterized protein n=1 Tax=Cohnella herbarum TaxID=2728023 RepID=A0A7Z2VKH2_9BACL|nr:hypothetical protein [Cohnella herbarum]QJD84539.1 hypothetical protein HH215_16045 [Cohnella herbarum]
MKKVVSVLLMLVMVLGSGSSVFAATSTAPSKAQLAVISKYLTAVETGDMALIKKILHPSIKVTATSVETFNGIRSFIKENDGYFKHFNLNITKYGNVSKTLGQGFKLKGYLLAATSEGFAVNDYTVYVYLLNSKGAVKFVTEKQGNSTVIEDVDSLSDKVQTKLSTLLTDKYGEDYFDNLAAADDSGIDLEEEGSDIDVEGSSGNAGDYLTTEDLLDSGMLTYEELKYSNGKFTNKKQFFSQIVISDSNATQVTFKFTNTGTSDLNVTAEGSGEDEVRVNAGATKTITFESDPEDSHLFIIRFDKLYDTTKSSDGDIGFTLSDLKVYPGDEA